MLFDRWHPVTKDFGLIEASVDDVAAALQAWHARLGIFYTGSSHTSLGSSFEGLEPLSAEKRRKLLLPTQSKWTAYFQSGIDGSDPFPVMSFLSGVLKTRAMRVCASAPGALYPSVIWEVYDPAAKGSHPHHLASRSVAASKDGARWTFDETGDPYEFEERVSYANAKVRDRFTKEMLTRYLLAFGLRPFEDNFYDVSPGRVGSILERTPRMAASFPQFSLAQVISGVPWHRP